MNEKDDNVTEEGVTGGGQPRRELARPIIMFDLMPDEVKAAYKSTIHNLTYHRPTADVADAMEMIRQSAMWFVADICEMTAHTAMPRERQMALRAVEDAVMYAIAGLARHQ